MVKNEEANECGIEMANECKIWGRNGEDEVFMGDEGASPLALPMNDKVAERLVIQRNYCFYVPFFSLRQAQNVLKLTSYGILATKFASAYCRRSLI